MDSLKHGQAHRERDDLRSVLSLVGLRYRGLRNFEEAGQSAKRSATTDFSSVSHNIKLTDEVNDADHGYSAIT